MEREIEKLRKDLHESRQKSVDLPYTSNLRLRERIQTKQKYKGRQHYVTQENNAVKQSKVAKGRRKRNGSAR